MWKVEQVWLWPTFRKVDIGDLMQRADPKPIRVPLGAASPVMTLVALACVFGGLALVAALVVGAHVLTVGIGFLVFAVVTAAAMARDYPHNRLGACNAVTLARAAMTVFLAGAVVGGGVSPWVVFGVAVVALALDGVDGWLARRAGLASDFGARFDMETDSVFAAVLALWLLVNGTVGWAVIVLGFSRYAFVAVGRVVSALQGALPVSMRRKAVCVVQIAALIALVCPVTPPVLMTPVAVGAALLLLWSFAVDSWRLLRAAR